MSDPGYSATQTTASPATAPTTTTAPATDFMSTIETDLQSPTTWLYIGGGLLGLFVVAQLLSSSPKKKSPSVKRSSRSITIKD